MPLGSRFCPECGARLAAAASEPVSPYVSDGRRMFGAPPQDSVFVLGALALACAVVLLALGRLVGGLVVLGFAIALLVVFVEALRRRPDGAVSRLSLAAFRGGRARIGLGVETLSAHSRVRVELFRLGRERAGLAAARMERLRALGEAVYRRDEAATEASREELVELDRRTAEIEREMAAARERARQRVGSARLRAHPTEVVSPRG